jgi:hypothetical protein
MVDVRDDREIADVIHQKTGSRETEHGATSRWRGHIKKGASGGDAPRTNKQWQLHSLGFHCRQKARNAHPWEKQQALSRRGNSELIHSLSAVFPGSTVHPVDDRCTDLTGFRIVDGPWHFWREIAE